MICIHIEFTLDASTCYEFGSFEGFKFMEPLLASTKCIQKTIACDPSGERWLYVLYDCISRKSTRKLKFKRVDLDNSLSNEAIDEQ
jgi:hypothetical protein